MCRAVLLMIIAMLAWDRTLLVVTMLTPGLRDFIRARAHGAEGRASKGINPCHVQYGNESERNPSAARRLHYSMPLYLRIVHLPSLESQEFQAPPFLCMLGTPAPHSKSRHHWDQPLKTGCERLDWTPGVLISRCPLMEARACGRRRVSGEPVPIASLRPRSLASLAGKVFQDSGG